MNRAARARTLRASALGLLFAGSFAATLGLNAGPAVEPVIPAPRLSLRALPSAEARVLPTIRLAARVSPSPEIGLPNPPDELETAPSEEETPTDPRLLLAALTSDPVEDVRTEAWALDGAFQLEEPVF